MKSLIEIIDNYLIPLGNNFSKEIIDDKNGYRFGSQIDVFSSDFEIDRIREYQIAILGVGEYRNSPNKSELVGVNIIRSYLYELYAVNASMKILDLGNLKLGSSVQDTYFALKDVIKELINIGIIPLIIGGGHDLTYAQYMAYKDNGSQVNLTTIDNKLDLGAADSDLSSTTYLSKIVVEDGGHLFNYTNLGHQKYLVPFQDVDMMNKLFFDTLRVGELQERISLCEPVLRDSNIVSFDMASIRMSESPGSILSSPNGLFANEACHLAYYSGVSDNVSSFGIFEYNPDLDINGQSGKLAAQIIWHFIDGFYMRMDDILSLNEEELKKFSVEVSVSDHKIVFLHSPKSNRWWLIVPVREGDRGKNRIVSCSSEDYKIAVDGEVPDKWWKTYQLIG